MATGISPCVDDRYPHNVEHWSNRQTHPLATAARGRPHPIDAYSNSVTTNLASAGRVGNATFPARNTKIALNKAPCWGLDTIWVAIVEVSARMQEPTFGSLEFAHKRRQTRRERFPERLTVLCRGASWKLGSRRSTPNWDADADPTRRLRCVVSVRRIRSRTESPAAMRLRGAGPAAASARTLASE